MQFVLKIECRPAKTDSSVCNQRDYYKKLYHKLRKVKVYNQECLNDLKEEEGFLCNDLGENSMSMSTG